MRRTIEFLLNGDLVEICDIPPTTTVLNYLRENQNLKGTKEGCAEGDCGACTVILSSLKDNEITHQSVNACILFLPMIDGQALTTIEHVGNKNTPHPIQKAFIDNHATQCGFCTPGFVMSGVAHQLNKQSNDRDTLNDTFSGNLCRCTGYRPIIDAMQSLKNTDNKVFNNGIKEKLLELKEKQSLTYQNKEEYFFAPQGIDNLSKTYIEHPDAVLLSGATDIGLWVTKGHQKLQKLIYLKNVPELNQIKKSNQHIEFGAATSWTDIAHSLKGYYPDFDLILRRFGSVQIRNTGTIGGNIGNASPIGDSMPLLIALGAQLNLQKGSTVRQIPIEDFFIEYQKTDLSQGEFIRSVTIPLYGLEKKFAAYKISKRFDEDISAVCGAFMANIDNGVIKDIRISYGGMAATPKRAYQTENFLKNKPLSEEIFIQSRNSLLKDFQPITDARASKEYRNKIAQQLLYKFYLETLDGQKVRISYAS